MSHPERACNGGPNGAGRCGKPATWVCTDKDGLQWYACDDYEHQESSIVAEPIKMWFARIDSDKAERVFFRELERGGGRRG